MAAMTDDLKLLRAYGTHGSEDAFRTLVERHLGLVYASALRQVGDTHLAQDVAQAVFLILARKAATLGPGIVLSGWLFRTTRFASNAALRTAKRRQHWEQKSAQMQPTITESSPDPSWSEIAPLLDEAISKLGETDRHAILLRFFERQEFREVGRAIGSGEDAAKKRVSRALEKMRRFFARRGVALSITVLAGAVSAHGVQAAPAALSAAIPALLAAPASTTLLGLISQTMKAMFVSKLKTAAALTSALIGLGGAGSLVVATVARGPTDTFVLSDGTQAKLLGVTVGTNTTFRFGSVFERLQARLPGQAGAGAAARISARTDPDVQASVVFWFSYDHPSKSPNWIEVNFAQGGLEQFLLSWHVPPKRLPNGEMVTYCGHRIWPRRDKVFQLRVSEALPGGGRRPLGQARLSNPAQVVYPDWTPERLPATASVGDVGFQLEEVDFTRGLQEFKALRPGGRAAPLDVRLRISDRGRPSTDWEAWSYQVKDATGNLYPDLRAPWYAPPKRIGANAKGQLQLPIRSYVWPAERAFKLGLEMVCARGWTSNQVFVVRGVPAQPDAKGYYRKWTTNTPQGVVRFWVGPDAEEPSQRHCLTEFEPERIELDARTYGVPRLLILGATDDQGRSVEPFEQRKLFIPEGATTLDVTVVAARREYVEYILESPSRDGVR